ncbi:MAG: hypothetical protein Q8P17_00085 [bacterium]|nr:hypothetical protein [bacterium]
MKTIFEHINRVKSKPHHIRRRVAFSAAAVGTAVIALVWLVGSLGTGAFALKSSSFADNAGEETIVSENGDSKDLSGVAAVLQSAPASEPARIEIVDSAKPESSSNKTEQTVIPF